MELQTKNPSSVPNQELPQTDTHKKLYDKIIEYAVCGLYFLELKKKHCDFSFSKNYSDYIRSKLEQFYESEQSNAVALELNKTKENEIIKILQGKSNVPNHIKLLEEKEKRVIRKIQKQIINKYSWLLSFIDENHLTILQETLNDFKNTTEISNYPLQFYVSEESEQQHEREIINLTTKKLADNESSQDIAVSIKEIFCLSCLELLIQLLSPRLDDNIYRRLCGFFSFNTTKKRSVRSAVSPTVKKAVSQMLSDIDKTERNTIYKYWLDTANTACNIIQNDALKIIKTETQLGNNITLLMKEIDEQIKLLESLNKVEIETADTNVEEKVFHIIDEVFNINATILSSIHIQR